MLLKTGILYFTTCFHGFGILRHVDPFVGMLHILCKYGCAELWENQEVDNESRFIKLFEQRCADTDAQSCHEQIQQSSRCRLYKELKENHDIEPYLGRNISCTLRITFTKMRLSSHKLLVKRGRWVSLKLIIVIDCVHTAMNMTYKMNTTHS